MKNKYGALSNTTITADTLKYELGLNNLYPDFEFIISSCDFCLRKPNKIIFELARRKLGYKAEEIWFIGDSYKYDVEGSKNAGMVPVWYNRKNKPAGESKGYIEVKSIREIIEMIIDLYKK